MELGSLAARPKTAQGLALRARISLSCVDEIENQEVAHRLGVHPVTTGKRRRRFLS